MTCGVQGCAWRPVQQVRGPAPIVQTVMGCTSPKKRMKEEAEAVGALAVRQCLKQSGLSSILLELCAEWQSLVLEQVLVAGWATYLAGSLACSVPLPDCKLLSFCCPGLGIAVNLHLWQVRDCCHDKLGHHVSSYTGRSPASESDFCV